MYLMRRRSDPLRDESTEAAVEYLKSLGPPGGLVGWPEHGEPSISLEARIDSRNYCFRNDQGASVYHYRVTRTSNESPWVLSKVWRTDGNDQLAEEYPIASTGR
jgi:hypothetical protein